MYLGVGVPAAKRCTAGGQPAPNSDSSGTPRNKDTCKTKTDTAFVRRGPPSDSPSSKGEKRLGRTTVTLKVCYRNTDDGLLLTSWEYKRQAASLNTTVTKKGEPERETQTPKVPCKTWKQNCLIIIKIGQEFHWDRNLLADHDAYASMAIWWKPGFWLVPVEGYFLN